ncbi:hypothetical protein [Pseudomonas sp. CCC2.2]|uniref:hypothetical protein n=1 Tax=Pseudomonas sp. CCC2.2 TaxID=3048605 RepID=UPI002B231525|nr:hypothetical protein [Pseudomonas sp. CCC2.2]MEB0149047.1 hypothetical protein [Pseudomonas sp. CCC2.2]
MSNLQHYIQQSATHGTHRTVVLLEGDSIPIKKLCKALKSSIQYMLGTGVSHRAVWFKVTTGIVLIVSGSRLTIDTTMRFLDNYSGAFQQHHQLYSGRGSKVFITTVGQQFTNYDKTPRSFGGSR